MVLAELALLDWTNQYNQYPGHHHHLTPTFSNSMDRVEEDEVRPPDLRM